MTFQKNACKNTVSKIIDPCGADQFQCKTGVCIYTDNSDCNGPCILRSWVNDKTEDCSDGSDEDYFYFDYDYDNNDFDDYDYDEDDDLKAVFSEMESVDLNTVEIPTSNVLRLKVIQ